MDVEVAAARRSEPSSEFTFLRGIRVPSRAIAVIVGAAEAAVIVFGGALGQFAYERTGSLSGSGLDAISGIGLLSSIVYVSLARSADLYGLPSLLNPGKHLRQILAVCGLVLLSLTAMLFILKVGSHVSRGVMVGFAVAMLLLCCSTRFGASALIERMMARQAIVGSPGVLIGDPDELASLTPTDLLRQFGLWEVGRVTLDPASQADAASDRRRIEDALSLARVQQAAEIIVATSWDSPTRLTRIEHALRISPLPAKLLPSREHRGMIRRYGPARDATAHLLDLQRAPMSISARIAKRGLDVIGASVALIILLPVALLTACAIVLGSSGPIFFLQRRNGFDQRQFTIFKFRTMHVLEDGSTVVQARRDDSRITWVGRFLRRSSIDEIPQLLNVLWGDMSLVGPRPHALAHDREYTMLIDDYCLRQHMKPGMTGWAQVHGLRGETADPGTMRRRVDLDLDYIRNWSILLDLRILLQTCVALVAHDAY